MQTMFNAHEKIQKKDGKSKKRKKRSHDSSDSSDNEWETGYGNAGFSVDKHLKRDKPFSTVDLSTEPRPSKVAATAPSDTTRADEITIKTDKTCKVTALVAVMSIFSEKRCNLRNAKSRNKKPSYQKAESADFLEVKFLRIKKPFSENKKRLVAKEISA
jgi:hypothetical protein